MGGTVATIGGVIFVLIVLVWALAKAVGARTRAEERMRQWRASRGALRDAETELDQDLSIEERARRARERRLARLRGKPPS